MSNKTVDTISVEEIVRDSKVSAPKGMFIANLTKSNEKIEAEKVAALCSKAETYYRREIENQEMELSKLEEKRKALLDAISKTNPSDFNAAQFAEKDADLSNSIRVRIMKMKVAKARYAMLFTDGEPTAV